ncbi:S41 family peptidase [Taibaiella sp. KBW10]|uniref:S41 family peptidase n=1 Tax=Taibaiella sp. KBW10 TaxID=2153357 RepID=UPI0013152747|nr:S41 family peptidase [Taibaiella sp. KBW10]
MRQLYPLLLLLCVLAGCTSVAKFNKHRSAPISVKKLHKDIDFVQHKLKQKHPNYDLYTNKAQFEHKFDSIRQVVNHPMTANEFFLVISPVVAAVRQGHMTMLPLAERYTKTQQKAMKAAGKGPVSQFDYFWENQKLYVLNNHSDHKEIARGAEVMSIKGLVPKAVFDKYKHTFTSDGYNQTFLRKIFARRFPVYLVEEIGVNDSLSFVFKQNDSVLTKVIRRQKEEIKPEAGKEKKSDPKIVKAPAVAIIKDSVKADTTKTLVQTKEQKQQEEKNKSIYGYDKTTKKYTRSLKFMGKDSSVAVLTIRQFMTGQFRKAYANIFDSIEKQGSKTLILDIRDNPGGSAKEIVKLYAYFADTAYTFYKPTEVVSKTSMFRAGLFQRVPKFAYPFLGLYYPFYVGDRFFGTKKKAGHYYYYNLYGTQEKAANEKRFKGKVYVLINGGCFSAACLLSSELKAISDITFVGEETGGDFNGTVAGVMPLFKLPHSRLPWRLGLMHIQPKNQTSKDGRGIFPDKEIIQTYEDKKNDKDPEMDWVMKQIEP